LTAYSLPSRYCSPLKCDPLRRALRRISLLTFAAYTMLHFRCDALLAIQTLVCYESKPICDVLMTFVAHLSRTTTFYSSRRSGAHSFISRSSFFCATYFTLPNAL
jgi:hypothetical protein